MTANREFSTRAVTFDACVRLRTMSFQMTVDFGPTDPPTDTAAARAAVDASDEGAFAALAARHRRELHVHCYRLLGSFDDAEDVVQETLLRAWRARDRFEGRASFRAWLYRIATNASLDALARRPRAAGPPVVGPGAMTREGVPEVAWLQPYPDRLLDELEADDEAPDAAVVARETIELAFVAAIQHLPARQRAVLICRDVLGWRASETAQALDVTVAAANSALQRARATLQRILPPERLEWEPGPQPSAEERALLQRYVEASEQGDPEAMLQVLRDDVRFSMPPEPGRWSGAEQVVACWVEGGFGQPWFGELRLLPARANRQPAMANYVRGPGDVAFRPMSLDVLRVEDGRIAEIVTFGPGLFPAFGLPPTC